MRAKITFQDGSIIDVSNAASVQIDGFEISPIKEKPEKVIRSYASGDKVKWLGKVWVIDRIADSEHYPAEIILYHAETEGRGRILKASFNRDATWSPFDKTWILA